MEFIFLCIAAVSMLPSRLAMRKSNEDLEEWEKFKNSYAKVYNSKDEEVLRKSIFFGNLQFIQDHNRRYANEEESYSVQVNQFADLLDTILDGFMSLPDGLKQTNQEFRMMMTGYKSKLRKRSKNDAKRFETYNFPFAVDWRTSGAVTDVKDQGSCGASWAFSTTGSLEGQLFRKTGYLQSLSEQNLIDCSSVYGNDGCSGGVVDFAFKYVIKNKGIYPEESYAYEGREGNCSVHSENKLAAASSYIDLPMGSEFNLMEAVATVGPVSVAIDAGYIGLQFYSYGVYKSPDCSRTVLNHAMLVVGYGTKSGRWLWDGDYWTVKNSWGTSWGMDGYVWVARNLDNMCGIATEASYPVL